MTIILNCFPLLMPYQVNFNLKHSNNGSIVRGIYLFIFSHTQVLQSFFDRLLDHQIDIKGGSTYPMDLEMEVNHFNRILQTCLVDVTLNPALMLDFNCGVEGVPTVDLTKDEVEVRYLSLQGNIAEDPEEDLEMLAPAPGPSTHQPAIHDVSSKAQIPPVDEE